MIQHNLYISHFFLALGPVPLNLLSEVIFALEGDITPICSAAIPPLVMSLQ